MFVSVCCSCLYADGPATVPPVAVARAAQLPAKASPCWATSPVTLVQLERSPDSKPSWKRTPVAGVVADAELLATETLPVAARARTVYVYVVFGATVVSANDVCDPTLVSSVPFR